jgi:PHD/YefM family antitoxin component YafN of YafNO toxin-antitoxin module
MRIVSASAARQRFGAVLKAALREPVFVRRQNRDMSVIMSLDQYQRIRGISDTELESLIDRTDNDRPR